MKGQIVSFFEKTKKAGGSYYNVAVEIDGNQVQYLCTDAATMEAIKGNVGKQMDFATFKSKDGTATFMTLPKSGSNGGTSTGYNPSYRKAPPEGERYTSFAASYAKDIAVACINQGMLKQSGEIDATIDHYFSYFLERLTKKPS